MVTCKLSHGVGEGREQPIFRLVQTLSRRRRYHYRNEPAEILQQRSWPERQTAAKELAQMPWSARSKEELEESTAGGW